MKPFFKPEDFPIVLEVLPRLRGTLIRWDWNMIKPWAVWSMVCNVCQKLTAIVRPSNLGEPEDNCSCGGTLNVKEQE